FRVSLTADDNVLEFLEAVKEGETLRVGLKARGKSFRPSQVGLKASITLPALESIGANGASKVTIDGFASDKPFRALASGASRLEGSLKAGAIDIHASGGSTVTLRGSAKDAKILASGASMLSLSDFTLAAEKLIVDASGAVHVALRGSAKVAALRA